MSFHKSVLLREVVEGLAIAPHEIFLDCTINGGGHAIEIGKQWGQEIKIIGLDLDATALDRARANFETVGVTPTLIQSNFTKLDSVLDSLGIDKVHKILFDLGWSTDQAFNSGRGFSFNQDEPLVMTLKSEVMDGDLTAKNIVNDWDEEEIVTILRDYAEERFAERIARAIVEARERMSIDTTAQLVDIIRGAVPGFYRNRRINPATKTFQALRMAVNDELQSLRDVLPKAFERLTSGGRLAVISFHSVEDRIVKHYFKELEVGGKGIRINKKAIKAERAEILDNPRSRSAVLRVIQKN